MSNQFCLELEIVVIRREKKWYLSSFNYKFCKLLDQITEHSVSDTTFRYHLVALYKDLVKIIQPISLQSVSRRCFSILCWWRDLQFANDKW